MNFFARIKNGVKRRFWDNCSIRSFHLMLYDRSRFLKYAGCFHRVGRTAVTSELIMAYHVIEKGLTMPRRRLDFGHSAVLHLMRVADRFVSLYGLTDNQVLHAIGAVRRYLLLHKEANFDFSFEPEYWNAVESFCARYESVCPCVELHYTPDDFFADAKSEFRAFAESRHTIRHFNGPVPVSTIEAAVQLAMTAPSACNRQYVRVHCISNCATRNYILERQNGNRGFGPDADILLVVTSDYSGLRWPEERNDIYVNGGVFLMNLIYSLHYYKVGSCILNWSVVPAVDKDVRKVLGLSEGEAIVALVACGIPPPEFEVAASPRKDIGQILINHE